MLAVFLAFLAAGERAFPQGQQGGTTGDSIRVTMNRKATATTTSAAGKLQGKIRYTLDAEGRYETGEVYGPDDKLRFKTLYKYEATGRLKEETQLTKEGAVRHKIVYAFDAAGKPAGYSVFDASGKLLGQTTQKAPAAAAQPAPKQRSR